MLDYAKIKKDRSLSYLHAEGVAASVENAAIAYQSPTLLSAGASGPDIAFLNTITNSIYALLLVKVPSIVKYGDSLKRAVIILSVISSLGWLPLILVPIFFKSVSVSLLIALWVINLVPTLVAGPLIDKWLSDLVNPNRLGRYLSLRSIFSAAAYLSFFYVMGFLLDRFPSGRLNGFTIIFTIALVGSLASLFFSRQLRVAVPFGESDQTGFGIFGFIRESRQNKLGALIVFTALIIFTSSIVGPFFTVYMLEDLHFSYLTYTLVISIEYIARIGVSFVGGRWIDRAGAIKVLRSVTLIIPFIPILWLFSHNIGYLMLIQVLSGISWATYDLCVQSYLCRGSPPEKKLHYIIYQRSIVTFAAAIGPLLGAFLLNFAFPIFGNPILGLFLLSGILRLLVVIISLPRLKTAENSSAEPEAEAITENESPETAGGENHRYPTYSLIQSQIVLRNTKEEILYTLTLKKRKPAPEPAKKPSAEIVTRPKPVVKPDYFDSPSRRERHIARPVLSAKSNARQDLLYHRADHGTLPPVSKRAVAEKPGKVHRLQDNLARDLEYHKKWAANVTG